MSEFLHTQKEVLRLLHKNGIATFKAGSFSEAVKIGKIPYRKEKGIKRKMYNYDEVKKAILKAGIGGKPNTFNNLSTTDKLDLVNPPEQGQTPKEYGEKVVKELGNNPTIVDANIYKAIYSGKLEKLKYERESEQVINREEVEDKAFIVARTIRDKIMSVPERLSDELASINDSHIIKELLYKEFGNLLEGFSKDDFL